MEKLYWVQFDYRKNGRVNGRQWLKEYVVLGCATEAEARAAAEKREHDLSDYTLKGVTVKDCRVDDYVRGHLIQA